MFGKEVFRFTGRSSTRSELRTLVRENRKAAAAALGEQHNGLANQRLTSLNTLFENRPGWKRFDRMPRIQSESVHLGGVASGGYVAGGYVAGRGEASTPSAFGAPSAFGKVVND